MVALMRRLVVWVIGFAACLIAISAGAGAILGTAPDSVMAKNTCQLPCAFGVVPGITERETAEELYQQIAVKPASFMTAVQDSYTLRIADQNIPEVTAGMALAMVQFQRPLGGYVRAVRLYEMSPEDEFLSLGELLVTRSVPETVYASCDNGGAKLLLVFGNDTIAQVNPTSRLSPEMEITRLAVTSDLENTLTSLLASFPCPTQSEWRGFAAYWVYQHADPLLPAATS